MTACTCIGRLICPDANFRMQQSAMLMQISADWLVSVWLHGTHDRAPDSSIWWCDSDHELKHGEVTEQDMLAPHCSYPPQTLQDRNLPR